MEDEGEKEIIKMDNPPVQLQAHHESHDTEDKPSETAELAKTEENSDLESSILPQVLESQLLVGPPPFLSAEEGRTTEEVVTLSVEAKMHVSEKSAPEIDVRQGLDDAAEDDDKVAEEGKAEPELIEGDTPLISADPAVDISEEMAGNDISLAGVAEADAVGDSSLKFDGPEIVPSNKSLGETQDEVIMKEEETQIVENAMKMKDDEAGSDDREWRWKSCESDQQFVSVDPLIHSDDFKAIVTNDVVPTIADDSDNLQSFDVQSSIPANDPQNVDVQSPVASKLDQEDEASTYMTLSGTVCDLAPEPDNVEVIDYQSLPAALVSVEDEVMRQENVGITEIDATEEIEENPIQLLDGLQTVDDDEDEEPMEENNTEMETETDAPEMAEQDNRGGAVEENPIQLSDDLQTVNEDEDEEPMEENEAEMETETDAPEMEEQYNVGVSVDLQTVEENPIQLLDDLQTIDDGEDEEPMEENEIEVPEMEEQDNGGGSVDLQTAEENPIQLLDDLQTVDDDSTKDDEDEEPMEEDEAPTAEAEIETEMAEQEVAENTVVGKRKRGKNTKVPLRASSKKTTGEDVCFICFDGGELVLCDRRGCHKAYHPSCVNQDEAFFQAEGRWNCGWHLCSICEKNARYMCYTCTFSLCQKCTKDAVISCVRGNKGFCETCMRTVMLIENNESANKEDQVDFDDKSSWEYLFKDYWTDLKEKLSLTTDEIAQAKNPRRVSLGKDESNEEYIDANDGGSGSDSSENLADRKPKKRMSKRRSKLHENTEEADLPNTSEKASAPANTEWASRELLEFVMHMKDGDNSVLSQFDVQALLLEYIKRNKLRDPRRKSQIVCDARLVNLFGKARVGHFEMLKLLESHFLMKTDAQIDDVQGIVVDTDVNQADKDGTTDSPFSKGSKEKKRRTRKKGYEREAQSNLDDYAAIDNHNINLIYLRRKLIEDILEDIDKFHDTVVGTFVRIRISGNNQKQDLYRLVQVTGTTKADNPYKVGKRTTGFYLEVLNLDKTEVVVIDTISNQDFTEDECKRLRQSIKCGLINRLTVGDVLHKATEIHAARVNDWLEAETQRIAHLRDRASEKGRRKELRECVEKLQVLKTPEERRRRLEEIPEIHADPKMDPNYESEENESDREEETKQENFSRPRAVSGFSRNVREPISPGRGNLTESGSGGSRKYSDRNWEFSRSSSGKDFLNRSDDKASVSSLEDESTRNQGRDGGILQQSNYFETPPKSETAGQTKHSVVRSDSFTSPASNPSSSVTKSKETEKIWLYKDPSGKIQGPFSVVQLRKWNNTGYFPTDLRIWRNNEDEDRSMFLKDALAGRFNNNQESQPSHLSSPTPPVKKQQLHGDQNVEKWRSSPTVQVSKFSTDRLGSDYITRNDNLPSPTPNSAPTPTPIMPSSVNQVIRGQGHNMVESLGISDITSNHEWVSKQEMVPQQANQTETRVNIVPSQTSEQVYVQSSYGHNNTSTTPTPTAAMTQTETWRPQIVQQQQPNVPWAGNMVMSSSWGPMTGNQQLGGWGGPVPVPVPTSNMNWNMVPPQSQPPPPPLQGPMNPSGWAVPGNHPGPPMQQGGFMPGMGNPGWFPQMGNPGPMANTGQMPGNGWFQPPPVTNQPPPAWGGGTQMGNTVAPVQGGNANQNWSGQNGNNRFSGQNRARDDGGGNNSRGGWNGGGRSGRNNNNNNRVCQYHLNGHCKKGSACRQLHN
ncbi:zinc finger CCCH domain-containing protein 19-like [Impatiens glandulifera]|uniref:zinc finger CCCH domain-containing protein 19-like n=1 Tax=Impatiens glandulifera TaxID=253017 RepID=UPI001FB0F18E|nr:zinc finger CCCH domain-containing protein 19-like [Impatiens glandulifera]